jgi:teichuronic acid biosynthesis glycosyltransferase TuaC
MLRVLTLSTLFPDASRPGFGVFVERQTLGLAALEGVSADVVAPVGLPPWPLSLHPHYRGRRRLPARETWAGLAVHRPRFWVFPKWAEAATGEAIAWAILPLARELRSDVIDAEFFWPDGVAAMHLSRELGVPFSIKARGSDIHFWGGRPVVRLMLEAAREAGGLLAVSAALKRDMAALGMPEEKIRVHHAGVDLDRFRPVDRAAEKARLGVPGPLLVAPGALIPIKGQSLAIEALARVPDATLLIVGDGPDRKRLQALASRLGLGGRVRFLGGLPHAEMPALLGAADVMVLPSEREGLANVWLEALACGTPLVISDVGGAREVLDRPEAGRLVPSEAGAIAAAVRALLAEPPDPQAVRRAAARFSWQRNTAELFEHLTEIVRHSRESRSPS